MDLQYNPNGKDFTFGYTKYKWHNESNCQTETIITWLKTWSINSAHFNVLVKVWSVSRRRHIQRLKVSRTVFPATNEMKEVSQEVIELRDESVSSETSKQMTIFVADFFPKTGKTSFRFSPQLIIFKLQALFKRVVISWRGKCFNLTFSLVMLYLRNYRDVWPERIERGRRKQDGFELPGYLWKRRIPGPYERR